MIKKLMVLLVVGACAIHPQDIPDSTTVFLLGTVHYFDPKYKQDFEKETGLLFKFQPEIICSEVVPTYDSMSLKSVRLSNFRKADSLRVDEGLNEDRIDSLITVLSSQAENEKNNAVVHENLAFYYFLKKDFLGNSDYHWFMASRICGRDSTVIKQFKSKALFERFLTRTQHGEYRNIIFPAAYSLGIKQIYAVDYRADEKEYLDLTKKIQSRMMWGILLFNYTGIRLWKISNKLRDIYYRYEKQGHLIQGVNSSEYQNMLSGVVDEIYPKWSAKDYAKRTQYLWEKRNREIAKRIIESISSTHARRVLVTLGAAHIPSIARYLKEAKYKVVTYEELVQF